MKLTIDLPPDLADAATAIAVRDRRSLPNLVEYALARLIDGDAARTSGATVGEALAGWLSASERGERRRNTQKNYAKALIAAAPIVTSGTYLAAVDRATARKVVEHLHTGRRVSTANLYLAAINTTFSYAVREGLVGSNPFARLRIRDETTQADRRTGFDDEHLAAIFATDAWRRAKGMRRLSLLIQLYTGARSAEVAGLAPGDIGYVDGIPAFRFRSNERRALKNKSSERIVPVHPVLIRAGVMDLDLCTYDLRASKWTNRAIRSVIPDRTITQHSARHTFATRAINDWSIPLPALNAIGGWTGSRESADISIRVYGGKPSLEQLETEIAKVRYPVLDELV